MSGAVDVGIYSRISARDTTLSSMGGVPMRAVGLGWRYFICSVCGMACLHVGGRFRPSVEAQGGRLHWMVFAVRLVLSVCEMESQ